MKKIILLVLAAFLVLTACDSNKATFTLGFIPSENASLITPKAEKLAQYLEKKMDMNVEVVVPTEYETLIEGLNFGHIDASYMDSGPAWLSYKKANTEVVLAELNQGYPFYYSQIFVRRDEENIKELTDLIGKKIAFTSWTGSSGFIYPIGSMIKEGLITPEGNDFISLEKALQESFESYVFSGGYKQSLDLLLNGSVDAIGGPHDLAERYLKEDDLDDIKSIKRLGKVPSHVIVVSIQTNAPVKKKFVNAMLDLNRPENLNIIRDLYGVTGLTAASTIEHLGEFGSIFENLTGIEDKVLTE